MELSAAEMRVPAQCVTRSWRPPLPRHSRGPLHANARNRRVRCSADPAQAPRCSRRHTAIAAAALLAAAWPSSSPARAAGLSSRPSSLDNAEFYSRFPYVQPADILPYLRAAATPGDVDSVLRAIDEFASHFPMYRCGPEKGAILERLVAQQRPAVALELGTFMGYGSMRIARQLPPGGRLVTVEAGEEQAEVARQVLELAGVPVGTGPGARVQVLSGLSGELLPRLRELAGLPEGGAPVQFAFLDHCKPCYLPDLLAMEAQGLVGPGTLLLADNVIVPGTPDYLAHMGGPSNGMPPSASAAGSGTGSSSAGGVFLPVAATSSSAGSSSSGGSGAGGFSYRTELIATAFEVEERFRTDWQPQRDAMAVSLCVAAP